MVTFAWICLGLFVLSLTIVVVAACIVGGRADDDQDAYEARLQAEERAR